VVTKDVTHDEIARIRKLLATPPPEPTCERTCPHIDCGFVDACMKRTTEEAQLARTLIEPLLDALESTLRVLGQVQEQEKQTTMTLDGFAGDLEKAVNAQVPTEIRCPMCGVLHVDQDEWATTRLHRKHLCHGCGNIWQPYPVTTTGCDFHVECRKEHHAALERFQQLEADDQWRSRAWDAEEEVRRLREQNDGLMKRRDELLTMVANLSQTVPLESEVAEALNQRGALMAEIGTLKSRLAELERRVDATLGTKHG